MTSARGVTAEPDFAVRTDFFDDIFIPFEDLPEGAEYNHQEQLWIWNFGETRLYYDTHEMVRFKVTDEEWHDQTPAAPNKTEEEAPQTPYKIKGSMAEDGLGVCLWWDDQGGDEGGEEGEQEG